MQWARFKKSAACIVATDQKESFAYIKSGATQFKTNTFQDEQCSDKEQINKTFLNIRRPLR